VLRGGILQTELIIEVETDRVLGEIILILDNRSSSVVHAQKTYHVTQKIMSVSKLSARSQQWLRDDESYQE
jgi:hypothetical protein